MKNHTVLSVQTNLGGQNNSVWVTTQWTNFAGNVTGYSIFYIDFNVNIRTCNDSDFEVFTQSDCVLGEQIVVKRRMRSSICLVNVSQQSLITVNLCSCTLADYLCTYCFVRDNVTGACVPQTTGVCQNLWDPTTPPAICPVGTNYTGNPAYRRNDGTKCVNDLSNLLATRTVPCPPATVNPITGSGLTPSQVSGLIALGVLLGVALLAVTGFIIYRIIKRRESRMSDQVVEL